MKKATITVSFDEDKLSALEFSLKKEDSSTQARPEETLAQFYEEIVPQPVREFLDSRAAPPARPKRSTRPVPKDRTAPSGQEKEGGA